MDYKSISKTEAYSILDSWRKYPETFTPNPLYADLREELVSAYNDTKEMMRSTSSTQTSSQDSYEIDLEFGLRVYGILDSAHGFTLRVAADDGVWRYLAVAVIPDLVAERWGADNDDHFWAKPARNWLRQIWWYIHISWNNSMSSTREILKDNSTDEILNLIERAGKGYNVKAYQQIMHHYANVPLTVRAHMKRGKSKTLFRTLMVLNTAFSQTVEPGLFDNSEDGYVCWLFENAGLIKELDGVQERWKLNASSVEM